MLQKTYAITNLVDWKAEIPVGRAKLIVHFTGGAMTAYGVTPAEFTTSNPVYQSAIEASGYFRSGRITLVRSAEVEAPVEKVVPAKTAEAPKVDAEVETQSPMEAEWAEEKSDVSEETAGEVADGVGKTVIEASCREDVVEYMKSNFGYTSVQLRTKTALRQALDEHGISVSGVEL